MNCLYHPIYLSCSKCGRDMERVQERECTYVEPPHAERVKALREASSRGTP